MKINLAYKNILRSAYLVGGLALSGSASADIVNSDFSDGLNSWEGVLVDYSANPFGDNVTITNFNDFAGNFSTSGNAVALTTDIDIGEVYLFQNFTFDNDVSTFSLDFFHSDELNTFDAFNIELTASGGFYHNFVTDGLLVDISSLAGQLVHFEISFADLDFFDDILTVSDISITSAAVPEPSSFAFFAIALFAFRQKQSLRRIVCLKRS